MENEEQQERLMTISDVVEFESQKGMIKITFYTSRLDKDLMPNHIMKLSEIVLDSNTAVSVAEMLLKHAKRGNLEAQVKKTPIPSGLDPKKFKKTN